MLSPDQFRHAITDAIAKYQGLPATPENLAIIAELQDLLAGLPLESLDT